MAACRRLANDDHSESGDLLNQVSQPTVVVMGTADPDFPDPLAEANAVAEATGGTLVAADNSGHYPQAVQPETVVEAIRLQFSTA